MTGRVVVTLAAGDAREHRGLWPPRPRDTGSTESAIATPTPGRTPKTSTPTNDATASANSPWLTRTAADTSGRRRARAPPRPPRRRAPKRHAPEQARADHENEPERKRRDDPHQLGPTPRGLATGVRDELLEIGKPWKSPVATFASARPPSSRFWSTRSPRRAAYERERRSYPRTREARAHGAGARRPRSSIAGERRVSDGSPPAAIHPRHRRDPSTATAIAARPTVTGIREPRADPAQDQDDYTADPDHRGRSGASVAGTAKVPTWSTNSPLGVDPDEARHLVGDHDSDDPGRGTRGGPASRGGR